MKLTNVSLRQGAGDDGQPFDLLCLAFEGHPSLGICFPHGQDSGPLATALEQAARALRSSNCWGVMWEDRADVSSKTDDIG